MKPPKIVDHMPSDKHPFRLEFREGANDGLCFTMVDVLLEDGTQTCAFTCNERTGYFRQVFVRWDSALPTIPR